MKVKGFKKGMNEVAYGRRFELRDALKKALNINSDRMVDDYKNGKWKLNEEKAAAVGEVFERFGIEDWADDVIIEEKDTNSTTKEA